MISIVPTDCTPSVLTIQVTGLEFTINSQESHHQISRLNFQSFQDEYKKGKEFSEDRTLIISVLCMFKHEMVPNYVNKYAHGLRFRFPGSDS